MKILLDGHMLGTREGGNERYVKNLQQAFSEIKSLDVKTLASEKYVGSLKLSEKKEFYILTGRNNFFRIFYEIPRLARKLNADIVHCTYIGPLFTKAKLAITVHDLAFKHFPRLFTFKERLMFKYLFPLCLKKASAVIVPSDFSREELIKHHPFIKGKVHVTYEAADRLFRPISKENARRHVRDKFGVKGRFILAMNTKVFKKNIGHIVTSFKRLSAVYPDLSLVVIGTGKYVATPAGKKIYNLGFVSDDDLLNLYNACEVFVYMSLYEGFGLPVIEAISCKTPVIATKIKVLKEIYKGGVHFVPNVGSKQVSAGIKRIFSDLHYREKLIKEGFNCSKKFSWKKTAELTCMVYESIL